MGREQFPCAKAAFRWNGRANRKGQKVRDGSFMVRFRLKVSSGLIDNRRIDQVRKRGRFSKRPPHAVTRRGDRTHRLRFSQKGGRRGDYKVTVRAGRNGRSMQRTLTARKL